MPGYLKSFWRPLKNFWIFLVLGLTLFFSRFLGSILGYPGFSGGAMAGLGHCVWPANNLLERILCSPYVQNMLQERAWRPLWGPVEALEGLFSHFMRFFSPQRPFFEAFRDFLSFLCHIGPF